MQWAEFSIPIHQVNTSLYFYDKIHSVVPLSQMVGKNVAVPKGSFQAHYFIEKYPQIHFVEFFNNSNIITDLLNGKFDALIVEDPFIENLLAQQKVTGILTKSPEILLSNLVYALFPKSKKHLVSDVNNGIKNIPVNEIVELEKKWDPSAKPFFSQYLNQSVESLTLNEIELLKTMPTLIVGSDSDWPPIEYQKDGDYQGVSIDYLNLIKNKLNLKFKHQTGLEWMQLVKKARLGEVDLLPAIMEAEDSEENLILTKPYANFQIVAMVRPDFPPLSGFDDLKGLKVSAILDGEMKSILEKNHPNLKVHYVDTALQGLKGLSDGKIDAYLGNHFMIAYYLEKMKDKGLKVGLFTKHILHLKMQVHKKYQKLVPILNKTFESISNRENVAILNRWKGNEIIEINDQFKQFQAIGIPTFVGLFALLFYSTFLNRKMNAEIKVRTLKEQNFQSEKQIADQANRAKDDFLANMSHELRSPMNAIVGTSYLLNNMSLNSSQKSLVGVMDSSAKTLLRLINNILDLSKIEAKMLNLEKTPTNLITMCSDLMKNELSYLSINSENEIIIDIDKELEGNILLDSYRLKQILSNLLVNANKYTEEGSVTLKITKMNSENRESSEIIDIHFEVIDTGIGMSNKQQSNIFTNFNQIDTSRTRVNAGAGLGLKLTHALCKLMGSDLKVESKLNEGTRFYFTIEAEAQHQPNHHSSEQTNENFNEKLVMVVDDNPVNLIIAKKMLEKFNIKVISANSGSDALAIIKRNPIHLILMDLHMPEMDGTETCIKIRNGSENPNVPIYALSATTNEAEKARTKRAGMNGFLNKPIDLDELTRVLTNEFS